MNNLQKSLNLAAEEGDIDRLYRLIQQSPDVLDHVNNIPFVQTPLHSAASAGKNHFALEIITLKPSFGTKLNPEGLSPLHLALQNGNSHTVRQLVKFDKELVRVKGRERKTPLHYAAEIDEIDLLAEFLCACPDSIKDLTLQDETALQVAVKNHNLKAFRVLLGWLQKSHAEEWLNNVDEDGNNVLHAAVSTSQLEVVKLLSKGVFMKTIAKNSKGLSALDIALKLGRGEENQKILNILHEAGASKSSPLVESCTLADYLMSPDRIWERLYSLFFFARRSLTMEMRNVVLVVAVLIATATFQTVISPPSREFVKKNLYNDHEVHITRIKLVKTFIKTLIGKEMTYESFFFAFYGLNTMAFIASITVITIVLPWKAFTLHLNLSLTFMMIAYGMSILVISPSYFCSLLFYIPLIVSSFLGYILKFCNWRIQARHRLHLKPFPMTDLQMQCLHMLERLLDSKYLPI